jgi:hypothetical protein
MLPHLLIVHLDPQASNELGRKDLLEVLSKVMLGRDLEEVGLTNGGQVYFACMIFVCCIAWDGRLSYVEMKNWRR